MTGSINKTILFICTGNTCRSPMAAALFTSLCPDQDLKVLSAGLAAQAGQEATRGAVAAMQDYGIDLSGHSAQLLSRELLEQAWLVLTMTNQQKQFLQQAEPQLAEKILTLAEAAGQADVDVADPYGQDVPVYRETARTIHSLLLEFIGRSGEIFACRPKT